MNWQDNVDQVKGDWERDGYIFLKTFLSPDDAQDVSANIQRYISDVVPDLPDTASMFLDKDRPETIFRLQNMENHDDYFKRLYNDQRFVNLAKTLLDDDVVTISMQWFNKPAREGKETPPHQDGFYWQLQPNEALTMWLALDVVDDENGCIRYLPGSHKRGFRVHQPSDTAGFSQGVTDYGDADYEAEHPIHAVPGDMAVHHAMIVHRADPNTSENRSRQALGFVYFPVKAKVDTERAERERKMYYDQWAKEGKI